MFRRAAFMRTQRMCRQGSVLGGAQRVAGGGNLNGKSGWRDAYSAGAVQRYSV